MYRHRVTDQTPCLKNIQLAFLGIEVLSFLATIRVLAPGLHRMTIAGYNVQHDMHQLSVAGGYTCWLQPNDDLSAVGAQRWLEMMQLAHFPAAANTQGVPT